MENSGQLSSNCKRDEEQVESVVSLGLCTVRKDTRARTVLAFNYAI